MNNKKKMLFIVCGICLAILVGVVFGNLFFREFKNKQFSEWQQDVIPPQSGDDIVYLDGKEYVYNHNLKNILFLGIDTTGEVSLHDSPGTGGQADTIILFVLDDKSKTIRLLQISRNTMADIDIYKWNGDYYATVNAQIALQYAYGNGKDTSCWAMKRTVSELLYDLPIDGYISMNIDGIGVINDAIGGVTITIPEDYTYINSAFIKGETIVLNGKQAEQYVRYRDINIFGSNEIRMSRQIQYIPALISSLKDKVGESGVSYDSLMSVASSYIVTDLSGDQMKKMTEYELQTEEIFYVPGETVAGEIYDEFHVDEVEMRNLILNLFYEQKQ